MPEPIAAPADPRALAAELACLPEARRMSSTRGMEVRLVRWGEAPSVMHELGRLREQTFRAAGEGTGRALDLDPFDRWYDHLVLWELVKAGVGIGVMQAEIGDAEPGVVRALPGLPGFPFAMWLTAHRELSTSRRIRVVPVQTATASRSGRASSSR